MGNESGTWIMHGLSKSDPNCILTVERLTEYIKEVGFLPLFQNEIPGFSVEEHTCPADWWSGDANRDPWEWRGIIASRGEIAYGKFFDKKAGFIAKEWLPCFVNYRRDGYDFDALWEDGKANYRLKKIMDCYETKEEYFSNELKEKAGFGKGGEKNFDGVITGLQMQTYLTVKEFKCRTNKAGIPYGWAIAVYEKPENRWGYEFVTSAYGEDPSASRERIDKRIRECFPTVTEKALRKI